MVKAGTQLSRQVRGDAGVFLRHAITLWKLVSRQNGGLRNCSLILRSPETPLLGFRKSGEIAFDFFDDTRMAETEVVTVMMMMMTLKEVRPTVVRGLASQA